MLFSAAHQLIKKSNADSYLEDGVTLFLIPTKKESPES